MPYLKICYFQNDFFIEKPFAKIQCRGSRRFSRLMVVSALCWWQLKKSMKMSSIESTTNPNDSFVNPQFFHINKLFS